MIATMRNPQPRRPVRRPPGHLRPGHFSLKKFAAALALSTALTVTLGATLGAAPATAGEPLQRAIYVTAPQARPSSFAALVKQLKPSVVYVESIHKLSAGASAQGKRQMPPFDKNSPFGQFFRRFFGPNGQGGFNWPQAPKSGAKIAAGSGFFIDASGYIVTNNHVIEGADRIIVRTNDGKRYVAKLVGHDKKTDLALLKIRGSHEFPHVAWGNSDASQVGDWVLAIGNPFGLGGTVTAGIISARGRDIRSGPYDDYIQIDAPINAGNSGGPLFDMNGQVIGINSAIYTPNGGNVGIGFAIPSKIARSIVAQLKAHGSVTRGWLGVTIQPVTPDIASGLGLPKAEGSMVVKVEPNSPAARAGLKKGDVILSFAGKAIATVHDLTMQVAVERPGSTQDLSVWRNGKTVTLHATLTKQAAQKMAAAKTSHAKVGSTVASLGMTVSALTPAVRQQYGVANSVKGVLVTDVNPDGPAFEAGVRPGDVIVSVGQVRVSAPADINRQIRHASANKRSALLVLLNRDGAERYVGLPIPAA
jgi:serine protease Do